VKLGTTSESEKNRPAAVYADGRKSRSDISSNNAGKALLKRVTDKSLNIISIIFTEYFAPKKNMIFKRYKFNETASG